MHRSKLASFVFQFQPQYLAESELLDATRSEILIIAILQRSAAEPDHTHTHERAHTHTDAQTHMRKHATAAAHCESRESRSWTLSDTLPWTTKLTACLSACMRTPQSAELMCVRVRLRPMMESTYPKQHKAEAVIQSIQSTFVLCPFTSIDFELLGLTSVLNCPACHTILNNLIIMVP